MSNENNENEEIILIPDSEIEIVIEEYNIKPVVKVIKTTTYCDSNTTTAIFVSFCVSLFIFSGFIISDFAFAYPTEVSCQDIKSKKMDLNLRQWLATDGFIFVFSLLFVTLSPLFGENKCGTMLSKIILILVRLFMTSWTIVGAVLFWRDIEPTGQCSIPVASYMWSRLLILIIGFAISFLNREK